MKIVHIAALSTFMRKVGGMPGPKVDATHSHAQLVISDKCHAIKELVVYICLNLFSRKLCVYQDQN